MAVSRHPLSAFFTRRRLAHGSADAIAAYDWVDVATGLDTCGSVCKPAAVVGSYGIWSSWGSQNLTGVIPLARELDTAGFFARDPETFVKVFKLWYYRDSPVPVNKSFKSCPKKLIYPVHYFPVANPEAQALCDSFVSSLGDRFGIVKTEANTSGILQRSTTLENNNFASFQLTRNRLAEYVSYHEGEQALNSQPVATSLSITTPDGSLANNYLASIAGCPEIDTPIGQVSYESYISLQAEMLPVNADLIAHPGCDSVLLELLYELAATGITKSVKTG